MILSKNGIVKLLIHVVLLACGLGWLEAPVRAAFTSLYIFGDGASTTTNGPGGAFYYGGRYCNGRVWVEVLAERQGLTYVSNRNWSYFGHYSPNLVANLNNFPAPADAHTALFIVWVNNADFVGFLSNTAFQPYDNSKLAVWTNAINQSVSNHLAILQTLYAKGARTLVMPTAVDLTKVPFYVGLSASSKSFIRQRVMDFNNRFVAALNQTQSALPGLTILVPDLYLLLDNLVTNAVAYGLTNALDDRGLSIDALSDSTLANKSLVGPGANYIFWDYLDPTARAHVAIADVVQHLLSPVRIGGIAALAGSNRLDLVNVPIGRHGLVEGSTNPAAWTTQASFASTNAMQSVLVPTVGPQRFYRLRFPFAWTWP